MFDRFIPRQISRTNFTLFPSERETQLERQTEEPSLDQNQNLNSPTESDTVSSSPLKSDFQNGLLTDLFCEYDSKFGENFANLGKNKKNILYFNQKVSKHQISKKKRDVYKDGYSIGLENNSSFDPLSFLGGEMVQTPVFSSKPLKILDAPGLVDNFYYNVTSFGNNNNLLVALNNDLHMFDYQNNNTCWMHEMEQGLDITSISSHNDIDIFAVANSKGEIQFVDMEKKKVMRKLNNNGDKYRVVATNFNKYMFGHGTRFGEVVLYDIRSKDDGIAHFACHRQEICSLEFSNFNDHIFATGGNDNKVVLYDLRKMKQLNKMSYHRAAVKALSFSKVKDSEILTGGGYGDQTLCRWDINKSKILQIKNLNSQICNLKVTAEGYVITTHGWPKNQIEIRDSQTMKLLATFKGHTQRVLHLSINPKGDMVVTGSGDQSLRFWNVTNLVGAKDKLLGNDISRFERSLR